MDRPSLLVLVRHAESERNVAKKDSVFFTDDEARRLVKGVADPDISLTDEGRRQARETGVALRRMFQSFDWVYHSGFRRTRETAEHLLEAWPDAERAAIQVRHHLFIRERDQGYAYDMTTEEARKAFPWLQEYWRTAGSFFACPPGGESLAQVCERVYLFLNTLFRDRPGKRILVVSHAATLRAFRFLLERWTYEEASERFHRETAPNCSVTTYQFDPLARRLVLRELNAMHYAPAGGASL